MINKIQDNPYVQNYSAYNTRPNALKQMNKSQNVSFGAAKGLPPEILEALNKNSKWWAKFLNYAGEHQGEALNILVTAFGTAVICPLFIRYNPFSKEDKDTRKYSAWRQPISAIIAVVAQLTITKAFNNLFAKWARTPNKNGDASLLGLRADLRACPPERYVEHWMKDKHPEYTKEQLKEAIKEYQKGAEKKIIAEARVQYKDKPVSINDMICQNSLDKAKEDLFESLTKENEAVIRAKFDMPSEDVPLGKLKKFLEEKLGQKAEDNFFADLQQRYNKEIEARFGKPVSEVSSQEIHNFLKEMLAQKGMKIDRNKLKEDFIRKTAETTVRKEVIGETVLKTFIRKVCGKRPTYNQAVKACTEGALQQYISECISGNPEFKEIFEGLSSEDIVKDALDKLEIMEEHEFKHGKCKVDDIPKLGENFGEVKHNIEVKKMIRAKTKDAQRVFKTMNTQVGLIVTLLTLPITCGILNWAYPRIMEKIMPEMAAKKKQTSEQVKKDGGDK